MVFKSPLSGLRRFLIRESPFKMMKNVFYFMWEALSVLKIFTFLSWFFGHVGYRLDMKAKNNFKISDVLG